MISTLVTTVIVALVYLCLGIIVFAPTIFSVWFYVMARKLDPGKARMPRSLPITFAVNLVVVLIVGRVAYEVFVTRSLARNNALAEQALRSAVTSQETYHRRYGRYYAVGPVRGPYRNEHGLDISKDVILQVRPTSEDSGDTSNGFEAHAVHVWGREVYYNTREGDIEKEPFDSPKGKAIRSKLIRSVR